MAQNFPRSEGFAQLPAGVFIPELFSMKLLLRYYEESLTPKIVNMDYEGEIKKFGDKVNIRRDPEATVARYYAGMTLAQQQVIDEETELLIDNGSYWNIPIDDLQEQMADVKYRTKLESNASIQQRRYVDQQVLGNIYADAHADNILSDLTVTANNLPKLVVDAKQKLKEKFCPEAGNWMVVPYWLESLFSLNTLFVSAEKMGTSESMIRSGKIGSMQSFEFFSTPNLTTSGGYVQGTYGNRAAVTFANSFVKTESLKNPDAFGDLIRGLQVFGWKTTQPIFLGKQGWVQG